MHFEVHGGQVQHSRMSGPSGGLLLAGMLSFATATVMTPPQGWNSWDCYQGNLNETGGALPAMQLTLVTRGCCTCMHATHDGTHTIENTRMQSPTHRGHTPTWCRCYTSCSDQAQWTPTCTWVRRHASFSSTQLITLIPCPAETKNT